MGSVQIDYLTLSAGLAQDGIVPIPADFDNRKRMEYRVGPFNYEGESYDFACGSLQHLKEREHGLLLYRISGALCEKVIGSVPLEHFRVTRLDLCVDVEATIPLRYYYQEQLDHHRGTASLIKDQTLYVGSRKSDRFWRVYDKAIEQGLPGPLFRIELELKGQRARQARSILLVGNREGLLRASTIGVVSDILDTYWGRIDGVLPNLSLPRKPRAGKKFLKNVVAPFLFQNPWAVRWLRREGYLKEEGDEYGGV
jgi:hypothetical protein